MYTSGTEMFTSLCTIYYNYLEAEVKLTKLSGGKEIILILRK